MEWPTVMVCRCHHFWVISALLRTLVGDNVQILPVNMPFCVNVDSAFEVAQGPGSAAQVLFTPLNDSLQSDMRTIVCSSLPLRHIPPADQIFLHCKGRGLGLFKGPAKMPMMAFIHLLGQCQSIS